MDITTILNHSKSLYESSKSNDKDLEDKDFVIDDHRYVNTLQDIFSQGEQAIPYDLVEKYDKNRIAFNYKDYLSGDLDRQLAEAQSNWDKFGNAIAQTIVSEIGLGTVKAFPDMVDGLIGLIAGDSDYSNPVSAKLAEWQEEFKNATPIYSAPGSGFENGTDFGWWMQRLPSIASSLTLLIPATAATKGVTMAMKGIGKGAKAISASTRRGKKFINTVDDIETTAKTSKLSNLKLGPEAKKIANYIGENASMAFFQRLGENQQEAGQVMEDMFYEASNHLNNMSDEEYKEWVERNKDLILEGENPNKINLNDRTRVAQLIAKHSADKTFRFDWYNGTFDLFQMMALRSLPMAKFKGIKDHTMRSRRLAILDKRYGGNKNVAELKTAAKNDYKTNRWLQVKDRADDLLYGIRSSLLWQSTEGVEEAINFIAQKEGMHVGRVMLNMESESVFSDRLNQYMRTGELWENAFWGVLGGITFSAGANKVRDVRNNIAEANRKKKDTKKFNETTGEDVNLGGKTSYKDYWYSSEYKRVSDAINNRYILEKDFQDKYNRIMNGLDPVRKNEKGEYLPIEESDKQILLENLINERKQQLVLNAIQTGTIDLLETYLKNDKVKEYFKNDPAFAKLNESYNIDNIFAENLAYIDYYKKEYRNVVKNLNQLAKNLIGSEDNDIYDIPAEYLEMIAQDEVFKRSNIDHYDKTITTLENELNNREDIYQALGIEAEMFKDVMFYTNAIKELKALYNEKNKILNNKNVSTTISAQERINELNTKISAIRDNAKSFNGYSSLLLLDLYSKIDSFDAETFNINKDKNNPKDFAIIDFLNKVAPENGDLTENFDSIDKSVIASFDAEFENLGEKDYYNFRNLNDKLNKAMNILASKQSNDDIRSFMESVTILNILKLNRTMLQGSIINTSDKLKNELYNLHNYTNELRKHALDIAIKDILKLAEEVGVNELKAEINIYFNNGKFIDSNLTEDQQKILKDALEILNLHAVFNKKIYTILENILDIHKAMKVASEKNDNLATEEDVKRKEKEEAKKKEEQDKKEKVKKEKEDQAKKENNILKVLKISNLLNPKEITNTKITINGKEVSITIDPSAIREIDNDVILNNPDIQYYELILGGDKNATNEIKTVLKDFYNITDPINENSIILDGIFIDEYGNVIYKGNITSIDKEPNYKAQLTIINQDREERRKLYFQEISSKGEEEQAKADEKQLIRDDEKQFMQEGEHSEPVIRDDASLIFQSDEKTTPTLQEDEYLAQEDNARKREQVRLAPLTKEIMNFVNNNNDLSEDDIDKILNYLRDKFKNDLNITEDDISNSIPTIKSSIYIKNLKANIERASSITEVNNKYVINIGNNKVIDIIDIINRCKDTGISLEEIHKLVDDIYKKDFPITISNKSKVNKYIDDEKLNNLNKSPNSINIADELNRLIETNYKFNLKVNDKISYKITDNGIEFKDKSYTIGFLPFPKLTKDNHQYQINDGWITDINGSDDNFQSNFKDFILTKLLNKTDVDSQQLLGLILSYSNTDPNKQDILDGFYNHKYIKEAVENGIISNRTTKDILINGIKKILEFGIDTQSVIDSLKNSSNNNEELVGTYLTFKYSVNAWFEKVKKSFDFINALKNEKLEIIINEINEGELILISDKPTESDDKSIADRINQLPLINDKSVLNRKQNKYAIGVVSGIDSSITLSNGETKQWSNARRGNTLLVINPDSERPGYVTAFPIMSTTNNKFLNELFNIIIDVAKNNFNNESTILSLFSDENKIINNKRIAKYNIMQPHYRSEAIHTIDGFKEAFKNGTFKYNIAFGDINGIEATKAILNELMLYVNNDELSKRIEEFEEKYLPDGKDYFDFIYENGLIHVNTRTEEGKHYRRNSEDPEKKYNVGVIINRKIQSKQKSITPQQENNNTSNTSSNDLSNNSLNEILNDDTISNKGLAITKLLNVYSFENNDFLISLFPKNVKLDLNDSTNNAYVKLSDTTKTVYLTNKWLNMFNGNTEQKKEAVRKLIHEQLHIVLHENGNEKYYKQIEEVYNEYKNALVEQKLQNKTKAELNLLNQYLFESIENKEERLEEFLVESLTSNILAKTLNEIESNEKVEVNKEKESLLQKIIRILSDLFGIQIKDNTLYAKEYNLLRDIVKPNTETSNTETPSNRRRNPFGGPRHIRRKSSIKESSINDTYPSINDFVNKFDIKDQNNIQNAIDNGHIKVKCKI